MKRFLVQLLGVTAAITLVTTSAFARRDQREDLNFGVGVRMNGSNDSMNPNAQTDKTTTSQSKSQAFTPYVGYSFSGVLNLGLTGLIDSTSLKQHEKSQNGTQEISRSSTIETRGLSIFARFLFGKVFFFEGGAGYYTQNVSVDNEYKDISGGAFQGTADHYSLNTAGLGTHFGGGLELAISNGFYFTGAYIVRILQLRDMSSGGDLGSKQSSQEKHELNFGIAHYY